MTSRTARLGAARWLRAALASLAGVLLLVASLWPALARAQQPLPVPALTAQVIDQTGTLSAGDVANLTTRLAMLERETGAQVVVLMVSTTQPEDIASYAQRVGDAWKLGRLKVGDGVLMVVAKDDRRVWIATAKALEGAIPDLAARQIVATRITPAFKQGDFAGGIGAGVEALSARIKGEGLPAPTQAPPGVDIFGGDGGGFSLGMLAILFFIGVPILGGVLSGMFGRRLGSLLTAGAAGFAGYSMTTSMLIAAGAAVMALMIVGVMGVGSAMRSGTPARGSRGPIIWGGGFPPMGGGGGFGGGGFGGGGGFSSGGGGDFGGGGAGGSW